MSNNDIHANSPTETLRELYLKVISLKTIFATKVASPTEGRGGACGNRDNSLQSLLILHTVLNCLTYALKVGRTKRKKNSGKEGRQRKFLKI